MKRFSLQNVTDVQTNRVLRQVQDALNELSLQGQSVAHSVPFGSQASQTIVSTDPHSLRAHLRADIWTQITFPHSKTVRPNYQIVCRNESDPNREIYHELSDVTIDGFKIRVTEACVMELNTFEINSELHLET